jgi:hypothetical protein
MNLDKLFAEVESSILKMNKFSKFIFKHFMIICFLSLSLAFILNFLSTKYWDCYDFFVSSSENMLKIFQLSVGAIIISVLIDIVIKTKDT